MWFGHFRNKRGTGSPKFRNEVATHREQSRSVGFVADEVLQLLRVGPYVVEFLVLAFLQRADVLARALAQ